MSIKQGGNTIAGAATAFWGGIGGTLSDQTDLKNALDAKANVALDNITPAGKAESVSWGVPDYASVIAANGVASGTWTQCSVDSFVCAWGSDPYTENYSMYVSPDKSTLYTVGIRYDDVNSNTQITSFTFFVPKGWWFQVNAEGSNAYRIYPLKGAA